MCIARVVEMDIHVDVLRVVVSVVRYVRPLRSFAGGWCLMYLFVLLRVLVRQPLPTLVLRSALRSDKQRRGWTETEMLATTVRSK
jgi:hypothetical protein